MYIPKRAHKLYSNTPNAGVNPTSNKKILRANTRKLKRSFFKEQWFGLGTLFEKQSKQPDFLLQKIGKL